MEKRKLTKRGIALLTRAIIACVLSLCAVGAATYAWYFSAVSVVSYAPVSSPESLYIGAGHRDIENDTFEDVRYLYFNGMDAEGPDYVDRVFCIYGKGVPAYKIQLAFTTNNPYTYAIFHASESKVYTSGSTSYITHQVNSETYYYSAVGNAVVGDFLNATTDTDGKTIASNVEHNTTYGSYSNVQKNAEPLYWQTRDPEDGDPRSDFVDYYLLRVYKNNKRSNDRETDILCISAKATAMHSN